jgi:hypothetical protein
MVCKVYKVSSHAESNRMLQCSCTPRDTNVRNANGVNRQTSLGKTSLKGLLKKKDPRLIFHTGDVPYVGWDSAFSSVADSDFKAVHKSITANLTQRTTSFQVQKPGDQRTWTGCIVGRTSRRIEREKFRQITTTATTDGGDRGPEDAA